MGIFSSPLLWGVLGICTQKWIVNSFLYFLSEWVKKNYIKMIIFYFLHFITVNCDSNYVPCVFIINLRLLSNMIVNELIEWSGTYYSLNLFKILSTFNTIIVFIRRKKYYFNIMIEFRWVSVVIYLCILSSSQFLNFVKCHYQKNGLQPPRVHHLLLGEWWR